MRPHHAERDMGIIGAISGRGFLGAVRRTPTRRAASWCFGLVALGLFGTDGWMA